MMIKGITLFLMTVLLIVPGTAFSVDVTGVTDTEVTVGVTTPLSGPAAHWGTTALGMKAWADHVNAQGGVHGRKIKVVIKDDAYNPTRGMANIQEMKGSVFALLRGAWDRHMQRCQRLLRRQQNPFGHGICQCADMA